MVRMLDPGIQAVTITAPQQIVQRTIPTLERQVDDALVSGHGIDLILSQVQIIDSAGLNWLLQMQMRLTTLGKKLRLVDLSAILADVLVATRLEQRFSIMTSNAQGGTHGGS